MGKGPVTEGSLAKKHVIVIEADKAPRPQKLRVAAYARVSSDSDDQLNSFLAQTRYYTTYITSHEEWTFVDLYADEGITGTSAEKRTEFQRLIADCKRGRIDRILCKSISRFARNTMEEGALQRAIMAAVNSMMEDKTRLVAVISDAIRSGLAPDATGSLTPAVIDKELTRLDQEFQELLQYAAENGGYMDYAEKFKAISEQMGDLREQKALILEAQQADLAVNGRIQQVEELLNSASSEITEWDEELIRQAVETVKVLSDHEILVCLRGGVEIRQEVI